jgi:hypothetical protein
MLRLGNKERARASSCDIIRPYRTFRLLPRQALSPLRGSAFEMQSATLQYVI